MGPKSFLRLDLTKELTTAHYFAKRIELAGSFLLRLILKVSAALDDLEGAF